MIAAGQGVAAPHGGGGGGGGGHHHGGGGGGGGGHHHGGGGGGGGGHHHGGGGGGGHHGGGFRFRGRGGRGGWGGRNWGWGPEIVVVQNEVPYCVWREVGALPSYVFAAFAAAVPTTLADGSTWVQTLSGGAWWAKHTSSGGSVVFYECDFSGSGFAGLPSNGETKEKAMTMQTQGLGAVSVGGVNTIRKQTRVASPSMTQGLGAVFVGAPRGRTGLGAIGLGIPGPWGDNPTGIAAGAYEITGTQVYLRKTAGTGGEQIGTFNPNESSPNIIAGTPDQVDFAGTAAPDATKTADGLTWAFVSVKTGPLAGQKGFVAMKYMGPVGWTASHNGTGPAQKPQVEPPTDLPTTTAAAKSSSAIPWIVGGLVLAGIIVGGALVGKKGYRRAKAHVRLHRMKSRKRAYA